MINFFLSLTKDIKCFSRLLRLRQIQVGSQFPEATFLVAEKEVQIAGKKPFLPIADSIATDKHDIYVCYSTNQRN